MTRHGGASPSRMGLGSGDLALYLLTIAVWGTSWIALKRQIGVVAPEVSCFWRFLLSTMIMFAWIAWRGEAKRFAVKDHFWFATTGLFMFSSNFVLFLYGGADLPSGFMAVVFSLASIVNLLLGALVLGQPLEVRVGLAGILGALGVALLYWPEVTGGLRPGALTGLLFCCLGTLSFCLGNLAATRVQARGVPLLAGNAWGMFYGTLFLLAASLARGLEFELEWTPGYLGSLIYLAVFASVIAFAAYLGLLRRIGAARAGYATVLFPVVALAISSVAEGYVWTPLALVGLALTLSGNLLVLTRASKRAMASR